MKKFIIAGTATDSKGIRKVRFASNLVLRTLKLEKDKFTDINFVVLPCQMTKVEICKHLLTLKNFSSDFSLIQTTLDNMTKSKRLPTKRKLVRTDITVNDILEAIQ